MPQPSSGLAGRPCRSRRAAGIAPPQSVRLLTQDVALAHEVGFVLPLSRATLPEVCCHIRKRR